MLSQVCAFLKPMEGKVIVDATVGAGGHTKALLEMGACVIAIDQDESMLNLAATYLKNYKNLLLYKGNFRYIKKILKVELKIDKVDGILYDLGIATEQLLNLQRGFSFDSPHLDMRMDLNSPISCTTLINTATVKKLEEILKNFGEEPRAKKLAKAIIANRPITSAKHLAIIIEKVIKRKGRLHPATRTFQALRIAVNDELNALEESLSQLDEILSPSGVVVTIAFHSLEDRIIKTEFKRLEKSNKFKILTKRPIRPTKDEILSNKRARSAKLRAAAKL